MPAFHYAERLPAPPLRPWIRNYWWFAVGEGAPPVHHVPPDGCTAVVIHLVAPAPAMLSGPWLEPLGVPVQAGDRFGGVRFEPGALGPLLAITASAMRNRVTPAPAKVQQLAVDLRAALPDDGGIDAMATTLDRLLPAVVAGAAARDPLVTEAVDRLVASGGELPIAELAVALGCSPRTLRRRFTAATGQSPKEFAQVRRILTAA